MGMQDGSGYLLTSSKLWAKRKQEMALQYPLEEHTTNNPTSNQAPPFQGSTTSQKGHTLATMAPTCDFRGTYKIQSIAAMDLHTDTLQFAAVLSNQPPSSPC